MKQKILMITAALLLLMVGAMLASADDVRQTLTVKDVQVSKTVCEIRFDGNNALLQFSDSTQVAVDMQYVRLSLEYDDATGIGSLRLDGKDGTKVYDLTGRKVNTENLREGVYIINGKKYLNKKK